MKIKMIQRTRLNKQGVRDLSGLDAADVLLAQHERKAHVIRAAEYVSRALGEIADAENELRSVPAVGSLGLGGQNAARELRSIQARLESLANRMPPRSKR